MAEMTKRCNKCKEEKDVGEFYKHKFMKDGLRNKCKTCIKSERIIKNNIRVHITVSSDYKKRCNKCKEVKGKSEFSKRKDTFDLLHIYCNSCRREYENNWIINNKQRRYEQIRKYARNNIVKIMLHGAKGRAKQKNLEFTIRLEDIIIPERCPISGVLLMSGNMKERDNSPSLDRIDSAKGYTPDNIDVISDKMNRIKRDATFEEIEQLYNYMKKRKDSSEL